MNTRKSDVLYYIPVNKMPESCEDCDFYEWNRSECFGNRDGVNIMTWDGCVKKQRHPDCPIREMADMFRDFEASRFAYRESGSPGCLAVLWILVFAVGAIGMSLAAALSFPGGGWREWVRLWQ